MSVPHVKLMITREVPCREVDSSFSTPSTDATARSIGSVTSVSMSRGLAPVYVVTTATTGRSTSGNRLSGKRYSA